MAMSRLLRILFVFCSIAVFIAGCTTMWQDYSGTSRGGVSSSLVDYLYPDGEEPPPYSEAVPQLNIPLRVGLAFVPATVRRQRLWGRYSTGLRECFCSS